VHYRTDRCRTPPAAHRAPHAGPLGGRITGWRGWPALPRPRCSPRPEGALGMYSVTPSTNSFLFQLMRVKARSTRGAVRMPASNGRCSHVPGRGSLPVPRRTPAAAWSVAAAAHPHRSAEGTADPVANAPGAPAGDRRTGRLPGALVASGARGAGPEERALGRQTALGLFICGCCVRRRARPRPGSGPGVRGPLPPAGNDHHRRGCGGRLVTSAAGRTAPSTGRSAGGAVGCRWCRKC
jgi:hypothetical protein